MRNKGLPKSLQGYLSKLKKVPSTLHLPNSPHATSAAAAATSRLLSACKYPKTPSFADERDHHPVDHSGGCNDQSATLSDIDRFLYENFHSLYPRDEEGADQSFSTESLRYNMEPPQEAIRSSDRFFISPGTSNSLLDETRPSAGSSPSTSSSASSSSFLRTPDETCPALPGKGVAVVTFSKNPYDDFRQSMHDMVEAHHEGPHQPLDWDFMEDLLFCYLELNDRSVHKYILRAFTDLTVNFRRRISEGRLRKVPNNMLRSRRRTNKERGEAPAVPRHFRRPADVDH